LVILSTSVCLASESYDNLHIYYTGNRITGVLEDADYLDNIAHPTTDIPDPIGPGDFQIAGMRKLEYHGPVIYLNGSANMVRFPGGYATVKGSTVTFHYYTQDYLGNNRAVVNGSAGT